MARKHAPAPVRPALVLRHQKSASFAVVRSEEQLELDTARSLVDLANDLALLGRSVARQDGKTDDP
jgi:hypothetical protein